MRYGLLLLVALSVAGCSRDPSTSTTTGTTKASDGNRAATADESVAAVLQTSGRAAVSLRFVITSKPAAGVATPVRLDFTAADPIAQLAVRAEGAGLTIDAAGATAMLALTEAGKTVSHTVMVTPQAAGFSELLVHALPPGDGAAEIVYAIPLMAEAPAAPAAK
ncbi:MAG TPA: hypothetical protein VN645_13715 [Steroidobacteraceae bacterium]|nr:hypothetical protein [Steroidobacteraceae bacterium]